MEQERHSGSWRYCHFIDLYSDRCWDRRIPFQLLSGPIRASHQRGRGLENSDHDIVYTASEHQRNKGESAMEISKIENLTFTRSEERRVGKECRKSMEKDGEEK